MSFLLYLLLVLFALPSLQAQDGKQPNPEKEKVIGGIIGAMLEREHYSPYELNSEFSREAFALYLDRLDPSKQFLLASDVDELTGSADRMIAAVVEGDYTLLNRASAMLDERVKTAEGFYKDILARPFDFTKQETVVINPDSLNYSANNAEMRERWRKSLKYSTLLRYLSLVESEKLDEAVFHKDLEEKAREQVLKNTERWLDRVEKLDRENHLSRYINAIVNVFDPHTEYYPPLEKENFNIGITGQLEGIGAQLREEDGFIKVVNIVPGSASWRGKELEAEDQILKVAQGDEEPVDVVGASIDDAVKLIRGPKGTKVNLTVKKPDGRIKTIGIVRDVVVLEETYAKGAVIETGARVETGEGGRKFGYIDLPKFYTDFTRTGARKASDDIRRILQEFNEAGVEGVVLDLRNNGGGSLQEAVDIAGLFIEAGPVVQVLDRGNNRQVLSDNDESIAWKGDLVVMVNSFSASASEILSAMLQDYDRAVVVGAPTTFGKGTVQRFYDLDDYLNRRYSDLAPLGSLKITTQKFYRVNGISTQFNGVVPDVILPDVFSAREVGERSLEHALPNDTIPSARYSQWLGRDIPTEMLVKASQKRVGAKEFFNLIGERANIMRAEQERGTRSLNWEDAMAEQKELDAEADRMEKATGELSHIDVQALPSDEGSEARKAMVEEFVKGLKKDAYVDEALSILNDMHTLSLQYGWSFNEEVTPKGTE
ncbi:MAG: carboxy terminal-processing peptidase [Ignavibacteriae bacterium]|nr:carboxy terminal-processing peptidase [Ignavibacteriota bacterium]MCB9217442.1 carboxy terminal-processing peptidase [Ignavibacteria bacterium]